MKKTLSVLFVLTSVLFSNCGSKPNESGSTVAEKEVSYGVDLGLSVNWAACNVGADRPEGVGVRVPLGNVTGTVKTPDEPDQRVSGTDKDIAKVMLGNGWRMPTGQEMNELVSNCEWTVETVNGHNGFRVTGKNGNSIFLPNTGTNYLSEDFAKMDFKFVDDTNIEYEGNYWCGTPDAGEVWIINGEEYGCNHLHFNTSTRDIQFMIGELQFCCGVRPVHEK